MKTKFSIFFATLFVSLIMISCKKKQDTTLKITVKDRQGFIIPGMVVKVSPDYSTTTPPENPDGTPKVLNPELTQYRVTDADGSATFNFTEEYKLGQTGLFILDCTVGYGSTSRIDSALIKTIVEVQEEVTNEQIIDLP